MPEVVYLLGAGFNHSVVDPAFKVEPPLSRNFFQVLFRNDPGHTRLEGIRTRLFVDLLLEEIERYWHLDLDALSKGPFDIEECLTLLESLSEDDQSPERALTLERAAFALRNLLLMHLAQLQRTGRTPTADYFAKDVLETGADVITFNYDTLAESSIASVSGISEKFEPTDTPRWAFEPFKNVVDSDLDASFNRWNYALAYGVRFDEVRLPISGIPPYVDGHRYFAHPKNALYRRNRVLKLHGSIDWLRPATPRVDPSDLERGPETQAHGFTLDRGASYWLGELPRRGDRLMEPVVIPPILYKNFKYRPFPEIWAQALDALRTCSKLIVVGYSFPPTDFRTRRLFLEAFSKHRLKELVVVNPDTSIAPLVQRLTCFNGVASSCNNLTELYGAPANYFE